ncbi:MULTISPECIES: MauE/DoxX family redox-associated membrane protein [unclassified Serinicoccus]|uniref:MauE/DoxX family redox-associated membrane protein n=1 Tax=unclassified Serinicoccus TaxID=2643101 RepID=UPI00385205E4
MPTALSLAPLTLAAVLVLSGLAKLPDPGATTSMVAALRLPALLRRRWVALSLPALELVVAVLLLTPWPWTYALGASGALALCVAFLVVVVRAMGFHPRPTCSCFGRVGDHRITGRTVLRNALLVALSLVALLIALDGSSAGALVAGSSTQDRLWLGMTLAVAATAVLVLGRGAPEDASDPPTEPAGTAGTGRSGPGAGRSPATGVVVDEDLRPSSLIALTRAGPQLLVLVNCWCGPTFAVLEELPRWRERLPQLGVPLVHTLAPWGEPRLQGVDGVLWDPGSQLWTALDAGAGPSAVLVDRGGVLLRGPVTGIPAIEELVDHLAADPRWGS